MDYQTDLRIINEFGDDKSNSMTAETYKTNLEKPFFCSFINLGTYFSRMIFPTHKAKATKLF